MQSAQLKRPSLAIAQPLLDERALAETLSVSVKAIQSWRYKGGGPAFVRLGRAIRYRPEDVEAWLASNTFGSTTAADAERGQ